MATSPTKNSYLHDHYGDNHANLFNFVDDPESRSAVPSINEWEQLWRAWDAVTNMINHETMLFEQPIDLRHPFIFYIGHIPTFLDVMLTRHKVGLETIQNYSLTEHEQFADIFERGIDPDMDDPKLCNPHSLVPQDVSGWPSVKSILQYQEAVRNRLKRLLMLWAETNNYCTLQRKIDGKVIWMCFEHEAMHLETLMYMIVQSPNFKHPPVPTPIWYNHKNGVKQSNLSILDSANMISFGGGIVEIGMSELDETKNLNFGWDNEHPKRVTFVSPFELQSRPVTNGEYWRFWKNSDHRKKDLLPAAWNLDNDDNINNVLPKVKTSFGLCEFHSAVNWPVQVSCQQAEIYASENGMRVPTETEWIHFRRTIETQLKTSSEQSQSADNFWNYGFKTWSPQPLNNERIHLLGDVWEWTSTVWSDHDGFTASQLYPGYSSDFFDGKHRVVLGASWATHPRIAERVSFRNWYQWRYPYVFCGFRLCRSL